MKHNQNLLLWLLIIFILCFSAGCTSDTQTDDIDAFEYQEMQTDGVGISESKDEVTETVDVTVPAVQSDTSEKVEEPVPVTVYRTRTGKRYHSDGCQYLKKSKIEISLSKAKDIGLKACSKCNP